MRGVTRTIFASLLWLFCLTANAQHKLSEANLLIETRAGYGFLINHHLEMQIYNAHFPSFEVNIAKETFGRKKWQALFGYPTIGMAYWYSHLGNSSMIGSANAVFPFVSYPLLRDRKQEINFRVGLGLAYLTKHFDRLENYKYIAIGSHINAAINLMGEYRYYAHERFNFAAGIGITHFSNGSTKTPNYGINTPSLSLAFAYRLNKPSGYRQYKELPRLNKFEFPGEQLFYTGGGFNIAYKDMGNEYSRTFMIYNFFAHAMVPFSYKSSAGIEFMANLNTSDPVVAERQGTILPGGYKKLRYGFGPVYHLQMADLKYNLGFGFYFHKIMAPSVLYLNVGLNYRLYGQLWLNLLLRTHYGQADFVSLGLSYEMFSHYSLKR